MSLRFSSRLLVRVCFAALGLWLIAWLGLFANASLAVRLTWAALSLLPLVILAPFLLRGTRGGFAWTGFLSLAYFAQGVAVALASHAGSIYGAVEIFLSILLFVSASAALRDQRAAR